jgi:pyruvate/2-oxoglutarate dehydrogenase complex dihydrolipoamide dehydrogenase (E3) component
VILSKRETVLGVGIVGPHAGELIGLWQLAISKALKVDDMAGLVMPYPTLSEVSQRAAATAVAGRWRRPWTSRLVRLMRAFG